MKYSTTLGDKICEATASSSIGLRHICDKLNIPYSTVTSWAYDKDHELCARYAKAKMMQLYHLADEVIEIAENSVNDYMEVVGKNGKTKIIQNKESIARSRLRINTRIALITKLAPILKANIEDKNAKEKVAPQVTHPNPPEWWPSDTEKPAEDPKDKSQLQPQPVADVAQVKKMEQCVTPPAPSERAGKRSKKIVKSSPKKGLKPAPGNTVGPKKGEPGYYSVYDRWR